jgi:hypothetical protein
MTEVGEHYRPTTDEYDPGVYRVVGTTDDPALLYVGDVEERRVHTGELVRVPAGRLDRDFEPAPDPDAGLDPLAAVENALQGLYWQFRRFL